MLSTGSPSANGSAFMILNSLSDRIKDIAAAPNSMIIASLIGFIFAPFHIIFYNI